MTMATIFLDDDLRRPTSELVAEVVDARVSFDESSMILAEKDTDRVHFVWLRSDRDILGEVDTLVEQDCIPIGVMVVKKECKGFSLLARPFKEHKKTAGIQAYLNRVVGKLGEKWVGFGHEMPSMMLH